MTEFKVGTEVAVRSNVYHKPHMHGRILGIAATPHGTYFLVKVTETFGSCHAVGDEVAVPICDCMPITQKQCARPPQTKEETMNEIEVAIITDVVNYHRDHPGASVEQCAADLGLCPETVTAVLDSPNRLVKGVTVLADKVAPAIKDSLMTEDPKLGTKPIPTLAGAERDGAVHLPVLNDIKVEGRQESAEAAKTVEPVDDGGALKLETGEEDPPIIESEDVSQLIYVIASAIQKLATEYDYGSEEAQVCAQDFISHHQRQLKFLCMQAEELHGILEDEFLQQEYQE